MTIHITQYHTSVTIEIPDDSDLQSISMALIGAFQVLGWGYESITEIIKEPQ